MDLSSRWNKLSAALVDGIRRSTAVAEGSRGSGPQMRLTTMISDDEFAGTISVCGCPGRIPMHMSGQNAGKKADRDLAFLRAQGVTTVVSLMGEHERRSIGVFNYRRKVERLGMELWEFPLVDMGCPKDPDACIELCRQMLRMAASSSHVAIHCRCGMGRAPMLAACLLLFMGKCTTANAAIDEVRARRGPNAVQSRVQHSFIHKFAREAACLGAEKVRPSSPSISPMCGFVSTADCPPPLALQMGAEMK